MLVFVVPHERMSVLWPELLKRCGQPLEIVSDRGEVPSGRLGQRTLAITSWKHVLNELSRESGPAGLREDVAQLQGLATELDDEGSLPLRDEELTDRRAPKRLTQYRALIERIILDLAMAYPAERRRVSRGAAWTGRSVHVGVASCFRMSIEFESWRRWGAHRSACGGRRTGKAISS